MTAATIQRMKRILTMGSYGIGYTPAIANNKSMIVDEHYLQAVADQKVRAEARAARLTSLLKRRTYFKYFNIHQRYGLSFKNFNRAVDNDVWKEYVR